MEDVSCENLSAEDEMIAIRTLEALHESRLGEVWMKQKSWRCSLWHS
jgi:hypothetical protein